MKTENTIQTELPNPEVREPVRIGNWTTALIALLTLAGVRLARLDLQTAAVIATGLAPAIAAEISRRFTFSPAKVAEIVDDPKVTARVVPPTKQDPRWLRTYWPVGLALAMLAFAGPEAFGIIADGEGGTLSEWSRDALGTSQGAATAGWWTLTALLAAFAVWFPLHLRKKWPWERQSASV